MRKADRRSRNTDLKLLASILLLGVAALRMPAPALADTKVIEAEYTYSMGGNDSRTEARRIAVQESKRKALEQAGAYVAGLTQVSTYQLTKDEVRAYTAGIAQTETIADETRGSTEHPEIYIRTRCTVDTEALQSALRRYRENEELEDQLEASIRENDQLKKEREHLVKHLASEKDKARAAETKKKLAAVLDREESNEETHGIWTVLAYDMSDCTEQEPTQSPEALAGYSTALENAIRIDPRNQRAHYLLAAIYHKQGDARTAEREVRIAIQRNPSNPILHLKLGILLRERGSNDEALKEFHFVERIRPKNTMMLYYTGMTLKEQKRCGLSVLYLQRFLKDRKATRFPRKREEAAQAITACGGVRTHQRRAQTAAP